MADHTLLVFSWNDVFPGNAQTGNDSSLVGQTFTFNGGGDFVTYRDNDTFSGSFGDHGFVNNRIIGNIDGASVDEALVNPEYAYTILDSSGTPVGKMYAITKNNSNLEDIEGFVFDFQPIKGETYTLGAIDSTPATSYSNLFVCFARGTLIETADGAKAIEDIEKDDVVMTRDNGLQPIRWTGSRELSHAHLAFHPKSRPVLIQAGVLGPNAPATPLIVSPQHRMLVSSKIVERMTGRAEIMIPAKKLLELPGVEQYVPDTGVTFFHILCDAHELVVANGTFAETLYLGDQSNKMLGPENLEEIKACRLNIDDQMELHPLAQAGQEVRGKIDKLVSRHVMNGKNIIQGNAIPPSQISHRRLGQSYSRKLVMA